MNISLPSFARKALLAAGLAGALSLASTASAQILLHVTTAENGSTITFAPVVGAISANTSQLSVNPDANSFWGSQVGQVALVGFTTNPMDVNWLNSPGGTGFSLGTGSTARTDAFLNDFDAQSGTNLVFGNALGTPSVSGGLNSSTVNPFGTATWVSSVYDTPGSFNPSLLNASGDIAVLTNTTTNEYTVIGQWYNVASPYASPVPEPSSFAAIAGFAMLGLASTRRRRPTVKASA